MKNSRLNKLLACHPLLVAVTPVLFLAAHNSARIPLEEVWPWLGISLVATTLLCGLMALFLRRALAAACLTSSVVALFFLYGHGFDLLWHPQWFPRQRYAHGLLLGLWSLALAASLIYFTRTRRDLTALAARVTVAAALLASFSGVPLAQRALQQHWLAEPAPAADTLASEPAAARLAPLPPQTPRPDIYYIVLDGYARADVLERDYGFDNGEFLDYLRSRGFYIAERSCANYPHTYLSLASSLNLRYHDQRKLDSGDEIGFHEQIRRPLVGQLLRSAGYRYTHFNTNWAGTQCSHLADVSFNPPRSALWGNLGMCLRRSTLVRVWDGLGRDDYTSANVATLTNLPAVAGLEGPTFAFAHLITPHPPYVFDRQGRLRDDIDQHKRASYVDQMVYVNQQMKSVLEQILTRSPTPPIIILQADHGSGFFAYGSGGPAEDEEYFRERLPIFNAYLVPEGMRGKLYASISPVNTFRLLLRECFQQPLELLPERHFVRFRRSPRMQEVTGLVEQGLPVEIRVAADGLPHRR